MNWRIQRNIFQFPTISVYFLINFFDYKKIFKKFWTSNSFRKVTFLLKISFNKKKKPELFSWMYHKDWYVPVMTTKYRIMYPQLG